MDFQIQLNGLDQFLTAIYGEQTTLNSLLDGLGLDAAQIKPLREGNLQILVEGFLEVIRKRLTWEDKDLWFRLLARRFGLDGEPPAELDAAARTLNIDPSYAAHAEGEALQRCSYKTTLQDFKKELHRIALAELSKSGTKPQKDSVIKKLDRLADLRAAVDVTRIDYEKKRAEILKKVQVELGAVEAEYQPVLEAAEGNASALEAEIKNDVLLTGESIHSGVFQAIYIKGRISWDSDGINNYARLHPDVLKFRKEGQPSVSLRLAQKPSGKS